jgi:NADH-quinone oxidoreductase subunit L
MNGMAHGFWMIPLAPLAAAAVIAVLPRGRRGLAQGLAIGAMVLALLGALAALIGTWDPGFGGRRELNFDWFRSGTEVVRLGVMLDPLAAVMLTMVTVVGLAIFVFSSGYMAEDDNATRFFGFLSLFAAAMLGLVMANSLLLLFVCWEVMGLSSYLLIGFWFDRPAAAAAAKKAFLVTRIGDLGLLLGMLWLYREAGTLLFYDAGAGCLESAALSGLAGTLVTGTMTAGMAIGLLLFVGAVGKSGQVPLHVWLPDAMEGPTPVSALIHAATMVAAGVFLVARMFPLMAGQVGDVLGAGHEVRSLALDVVTWVGAVTAVFAALLAVGQTDIKRVLAYSTVSQLGYMFVGLGTGGVAVGMFHLITHAFFKSLLFLGAGSVIHGCHHEQDIRRMGGLRGLMPWTFAAYAVGMMALAGVPLVFSGFWSKDAIVHAAWVWSGGKMPLVLALIGVVLTAFYMTRQTAEVFFGKYRGEARVHESPATMTWPLGVLAVATVGLSLVGTPVWPWFEGYLSGHAITWDTTRWGAALPAMVVSSGLVAVGMGWGWWMYGRRTRVSGTALDPLEQKLPGVYGAMQARMWVDEVYQATLVRGQEAFSGMAAWADRALLGGLVWLTGAMTRGLGWLTRWWDEWFVNGGFDAGCAGVRGWGRWMSRLQGGQVQRYLAGLGLGMVVVALLLIWEVWA